MEAPVMQEIMDKAYERWREMDKVSGKYTPMLDFWQSLTPREKVAVFCGNLNYQVENGGWSQWDGNGYSDAAPELEKILPRLGENGKRVLTIMTKAINLLNIIDKMEMDEYEEKYLASCEELELDKLDREFYTFNWKFIEEVELVCKLSEEDFLSWMTGVQLSELGKVAEKPITTNEQALEVAKALRDVIAQLNPDAKELADRIVVLSQKIVDDEKANPELQANKKKLLAREESKKIIWIKPLRSKKLHAMKEDNMGTCLCGTEIKRYVRSYVISTHTNYPCEECEKIVDKITKESR